MKKSISISIMTLLMAATPIHARTWTDTQGREVEAEVVKVNPNKTVVLKTARGKTVTVPFNTFVAADVAHLEQLLSSKGRGGLHTVPWSKLNEVFGVEIWQDDLLWDDPTDAAAKRMELKKESKTAFAENHRAYPLGKHKILGEPVYAAALYGGADNVDSLSFIFLNQGDIPIKIPPGRELPPAILREIAEKIEDSGMRVHDALVPILGKPERDSLGKGALREKVWRWDWNGHAIMLSLQEGKYAALRIMPTERADHAGRAGRIKDDELKKRMAACVERRDNGDVVIGNIPMVDQGPKGYCSPATWERYLRYLDIPVDMYLLALGANTGVGGGTYGQDMIDATENIIGSNGRKLSTYDTKLTVKRIAQQIDKGLPIMWSFMSTPAFQQAANDNTARRNGKEIKKKLAGQTEDTSSGGHICLIIGYNAKTDEVAISDSWGSRFSERWVMIDAIQESSVVKQNIGGDIYTQKFPWSIIKW